MTYNKYNNGGSSNFEYAVDVYVWNQSLESRYHVFDCLAAQPLLNPQMRDGVLKWICSVNRQFRFHLETLCLTVALLDRFLFAQAIDPAVLQLAAATAFFVAAKVEEEDPPTTSELMSLCDHAYDRAKFKRMEFIMLGQLEFRLLSPTVAFFLKHAVHLEHLAELGWPSAFADRLVERCLRDYAVSQAPASLLASAVVDVVLEQLTDIGGDRRIHGALAAHGGDEGIFDEYTARVGQRVLSAGSKLVR